MAEMRVLGGKIVVEDHPNADRLDVIKFGEFTHVAQKGLYKTGDLVIRIPPEAVITDELKEELELPKNRVKAITLRDVVSEGVLCKPNGVEIIEGKDYVEELGITKYIPPIPDDQKGKVVPREGLIKYDLENVKDWSERLRDSEPVVFSEKIHGSLVRYSIFENEIVVSSKGQGNKGLAFAVGVNNIYTRMLELYREDFKKIKSKLGACTIFTEVFGGNIQDLHYNGVKQLRVFDVWKDGEYLNIDQLEEIFTGDMNLKLVPIVWRGKWSLEALEHTVGKSLIPGTKHDREGVVITPVKERRDNKGRVKLKSVSKQYLTRHETNPNTTEYN